MLSDSPALPAAQLCISGISLMADGPRTLGLRWGWRLVGPLDAAVAEVKRFDLTADDTFLVIGCDGIWDVLSDQQV
jgi:serine/threonine protein phosphatase PrpC